MISTFSFNRHEWAGAFGDLGILIPLALGMIQINGIDATSLLLCVGLYYIGSGLYFRIPVPVQPMKVIAAYAVAQSLTPLHITTSGLLIGAILLLLVLTSAIDRIAQIVPQAVIRGVQLTTGLLLLKKGVHFIIGNSEVQQAAGQVEPALFFQNLGGVPISAIIGSAAFLAILLLLRNKLAPAALVTVVGGAVLGVCLGGWRNLVELEPALQLPSILPYGLPDASLTLAALTLLALPQLPMTVGNAVLAQNDLTHEYFDKETAKRATPRAFALSMGIANVICAFLGGIPLCHGAGGLAAHYRFGARTAGANLIIGGLLLVLALVLSGHAAEFLSIIPLSLLGALLVFAGGQLALVILDIEERLELFVVLLIVGMALALNLAVGCVVGWIVYAVSKRIRVEL